MEKMVAYRRHAEASDDDHEIPKQHSTNPQYSDYYFFIIFFLMKRIITYMFKSLFCV